MGADPEGVAPPSPLTRLIVIGAILAVTVSAFASGDRSLMTEQTGPAVFSPSGAHTHTIPAAPAVPPPVIPPAPTPTPPPVTPPPAGLAAVPPQTSVGSGTLATAWAGAILTALGAPASTANVASMLAWFAAEDDNQPQGSHADGAGGNNPLDITGMSGTFAGTVGSEPSGAGPGYPGNLDFSPPSAGVAAMAQTIRSYSAIHAALTSGVGLINNPAVAGDLSEWSGGGYSALG